MENKVLFLDPLNIQPAFKRGTEGLVGAGILGATGLASGLLGSSSAASNNARMIEYNKWAQKDAQAYNTQMYERQLADQESMYNKYQSPQAIAQQLKEVGINPSALAAGHGFSGGSMPSVPSVGSSPVTSAPQLENTGAIIGSSIEQMSRVISNMADNDLKQKQINKVLADIKGQELANAHAEFDNYLFTTYGENEKISQLRDLLSSAMLKDAQKDYTGAQKDYTEVLKMIANKDLGIKDEEYNQLVYRGTRLAQIYDDEHELRVEEKKVKKSQQRANYASAALSDAQKSGQEFQNSILKIDSDNAAALAQQKLAAFREQLLKQSNLDRKERLRAEAECEKLDKLLKSYREHPNKAALDATLDNFNEHFPILGGFIRAFSK